LVKDTQEDEHGKNTIVFKNDKPGGTKCLRPFLKSYEQETAVMAKRISVEHSREVTNLVPHTFTVNNKQVTAVFTVVQSMQDGKQIKYMTEHILRFVIQ
jgi:hypothetical protein